MSEFLLRAVGELKSVGLSQVAKVVLEFAEAVPDEASLCPYDPESHNGKGWLRSLEQRQRWRSRPLSS